MFIISCHLITAL